MFFKLLGAIAAQKFAGAASLPPRSETPIPSLTQGSALDITEVPLILAGAAGSLLKDMPSRNMVTAVGVTSPIMGQVFFHVYLSGLEGAFLQITVHQDHPKDILQIRLYQPYHEIIPLYASAEEVPSLAAPEPEEFWSTWLLEDSNPAVGGLIGCPLVGSKTSDIDPATNGPFAYERMWMPSPIRIAPITVMETIYSANGGVIQVNHMMMQYGRSLAAGKDVIVESMILSAVSTNSGASVNYWLGLDLTLNDLTVYPPAN